MSPSAPARQRRDEKRAALRATLVAREASRMLAARRFIEAHEVIGDAMGPDLPLEINELLSRAGVVLGYISHQAGRPVATTLADQVAPNLAEIESLAASRRLTLDEVQER